MSENRRISVKALAFGVLTDIGGSLIVGAAFGLISAIELVAQGVPENELPARLESPIVLVPLLVIGFGFTLLGGFVAGRTSKRAEVTHGGLVGLIGLVFGLLLSASLPSWYAIASFVGVVPFGMMGGRLAVTDRAE